MAKTKVAIVGASGYAGSELARLLLSHPAVELVGVTSQSQAGRPVTEVFPHLSGLTKLVFQAFDAKKIKDAAEVIFTALPHGRSMVTVPQLYDKEHKVIDLSGDFRLTPELYQAWYKREHVEPHLVKEAVYGLTELARREISSAGLVANPGCYATCLSLAVAPFISNLVIERDIIADAISGVSGAGRPATERNQYCQVEGNVMAYKAGGTHQHIPEIEQSCFNLCQLPVSVSFTPHLGPFPRGILSTSYAKLKEKLSGVELHEMLITFYNDSPFISVLPLEDHPQVKLVHGTNFAHLAVALDERSNLLVMMAAIDNLGKGAAGQAIQNMNLMLGLEETTGLMQGAVFP